MKKIYLRLFSFVLCFALLWLASADSILDFLNYAELEQWNFWYTSSDRLTIDAVTNSYVDVSSPVIKNDWNNITSYLFTVSTERWYVNPVAHRCFDDVTINWNRFSVWLDIGWTDWLDRNEVYYLYAVPLDIPVSAGNNWRCSSEDAQAFVSLWTAWRESTVNGEDPCFNIAETIYWVWTYCEMHTSWNWWSSDGLVKSIRNVTHECDWKNVTIKRESLADVNIDVLLRSDSEQRFKTLWTVNSERKSYSFTDTDSWDFTVKLRPVDGTQDINYTEHCLVTTSPEVTPVNPDTPVKPPVVWPKENIMLILLWTLVLYILYRVATRKRD